MEVADPIQIRGVELPQFAGAGIGQHRAFGGVIDDDDAAPRAGTGMALESQIYGAQPSVSHVREFVVTDRSQQTYGVPEVGQPSRGARRTAAGVHRDGRRRITGVGQRAID